MDAAKIIETDTAMTQTPEERSLVQLEAQYSNIVKMLDALPGQMEKMISAAIDRHVIDCINLKRSKTSVPPPRISEKGWETIKYIATLIAASAIGSGGLAGFQHFIK